LKHFIIEGGHMGLSNIISNLKFWGKGGAGEQIFLGTLAAETHYKLLALETCISFIANTLLACEFQTFKNGKEVRDSNYYLFNVRPNQNQSAAVFWHELIGKLYRNNEALVIMNNDKYYIADSFAVKTYVLYDSVYSDVTIDDFTFNETFKSTDVFHFKLNSKDVSQIFDQLFADYGKLLTATQATYKRKNTPRLFIDMEASFNPNDENQKAVREFLAKQFKSFFESDGAGVVQPLYKGTSLNKSFNPFSSNAIYTTRDIRALVDDIFDFVCMTFHIPSKLIKGDMVDIVALTDLFIIGCIRPLVRIIRDEINAKQFTKNEFLNRTYVKVDTTRITVTDVVKLANVADRLFAAGIHSVNENRRMIDKEPIDEPWANEHAMTKNYSKINQLEGKSDAD